MRGRDLILLACGLTIFVDRHVVSAEVLRAGAGKAQTAAAAPGPVETPGAELRTAVRGVPRTSGAETTL